MKIEISHLAVLINSSDEKDKIAVLCARKRIVPGTYKYTWDTRKVNCDKCRVRLGMHPRYKPKKHMCPEHDGCKSSDCDRF
jgi:hypothetical protein